MKGACFQAVRIVNTITVDDPIIEHPADAIVQVQLAGLCGSDLHPFYGRELGMDPGTVMGHEFVGRVVEIGDDVSRVQVGDLVCAPFSSSCGDCFYCRRGLTARCTQGQLFGWRSGGRGLHGGQAEYVRVPQANGTLVPLGDTPAEIGLLYGDNLSTGLYCSQMAEVNSDGTYVVIGCGTVGLLCILACAVQGAENILAIDLVPRRLQIAAEFGASATFDDVDALREAVMSATEGRGADAVMELVGLPTAQKQAYDLIRPGGTMSVIGCHCTPNFAFSPVDAYDKNLTYRTGRCSARHLMDKLPPLFGNHFNQMQRLFTHRFSIDDSENAYDIFANRKDGCIKAVLEINC